MPAPPDVVFEAWINPEQVKHWYGPDGFSLTTHEMDVRPGGLWRYTMHGPDGRDYKNKIIFDIVDRPRLLTYSHQDDEIGVEKSTHQSIATFEEQNGKTLLTLKMIFETPAELQRIDREYGAIEGGKQTLGRLERFLTSRE